MATALGNIAISNVAVGGSAATAIALGDVVVWQLGPEPAAGPWLCFTAEEANSTVHLDKAGSPNAVSLETSTDGTTWSDYSWTGSTGGTLTLANVGDKVYMRAKTENQTISNSSDYYKFVMTGLIAASGNILTLLKADGSRTDAPSYCYRLMFAGCESLTSAPALPATTLASSCYLLMFKFCSSLTAAPATLPATTLANECYSEMFGDCESLTTAPALPATTLASSCYNYMFYGCTSLTSAPATLPATTLADNCYDSMFSGCTSLTTAPSLPATTLAGSCYDSMFSGCTSLTTAPTLPATTLAERCYFGMFNECTSLTSAPELPATTLAYDCYSYMFQYCSKLASIDVSFTAWNPANATSYWVYGVAASGTFTCPRTLPDTRDESHIPEGWTVVRH